MSLELVHSDVLDNPNFVVQSVLLLHLLMITHI